MEPESSIVHMAFRQALLGILSEEQAILSPRTSLVLSRIAGGLRFFDVQSIGGPQAEADIYEPRVSLLRDLVKEIDRRQLTVSPEIRRLIEISEDAVQIPFIEMTSALAEGIAILSRACNMSNHDMDHLAYLAIRGFNIEQSVRDGVEAWAGSNAGRYALAGEATVSPPSADKLDSLLHAGGVSQEMKVCAVSTLFSHSSKQAFLVETNGGGDWPCRAVLRREPAYNIVDTSLADEFDVLDVAFRAGLPVPRPLYAERDAKAMGGRFILMAHVPGKTQSLNALGSKSIPALRQTAEFLAGLHRIDPRTVSRMRALADAPSKTRIDRRIEETYATWQRDRVTPSAQIEAAFAWLRATAQSVTDQSCIVHGDFDLRNIMFDDGNISAVVDWETSRLGHRAEDLAYFKREISSAMRWSEYMDAYERGGGTPVAQRDIAFFEVLSWLWRVIVTITAYSGYYRNLHKEFFFVTTRFIEYEQSLDGLVEALRSAPDAL